MPYTYDETNIFAKILRGEIPSKPRAENEFALCFPDIDPKAKLHLLFIPKGAYVNYDDFARNASVEEKAGLDALLVEVIDDEGLNAGEGGGGYRLITNSGEFGLQEVPHYHIHLLSKEPIVGLRGRG